MTIVFEQHQQAVHYIGHSDFVDNDLSKHLDSTDAFEGPEKTLEVEFVSGEVNLNKISVAEWTELLAPVECQILSRISSDDSVSGSVSGSGNDDPPMDVYLLSESTLVVHGGKMMLKTCGTTSTLRVLEPLFALVGGDSVDHRRGRGVRVRYSRPELKFPERQKDPVHGCWTQEVAQLESLFGAGEQEQRCEAGNTWYCWRGGEGQPQQQRGQQRGQRKLEIIMHDLAEDACCLFERGGGGGGGGGDEDEDDPHYIGARMMAVSGLGAAFPGKRDAFAFAPRGWSANSVWRGAGVAGAGAGVAGAGYATAHVTPERGCSYASYEAVGLCTVGDGDGDGGDGGSVGAEDVAALVLGVFRPQRYCVVWH